MQLWEIKIRDEKSLRIVVKEPWEVSDYIIVKNIDESTIIGTRLLDENIDDVHIN